MEPLICDDCRFASESEYGLSYAWCQVLRTTTKGTDPCRVSKQGLLHKVQTTEKLRDERDRLLDQLERLHDTDYSYSDWYRDSGRVREISDQITFWSDALKHLRNTTSAPDRKCTKCQYAPLDPDERFCPDDGAPLLVTTKNVDTPPS